MYRLWARIKGKDYPIAYGSTITDTFSETLDSATIILPHVKEKIDIKPYDDVIIHGMEYDASTGSLSQWVDSLHTFQEVYEEGNETAESPHSKVYRHMLCESPQRRQVNFGGYYTYTISCVSETKGLEFVQMPNRTITQPKVSDVELVGELDQPAIIPSANDSQVLNGGDASNRIVSLSDGSTILLLDYSVYGKTASWSLSTLMKQGDNFPIEGSFSNPTYVSIGKSVTMIYGNNTVTLYAKKSGLGLAIVGSASWIQDDEPDLSPIEGRSTFSPKSIFYWIQTFVNTYSPKIKYTADGETWEYRNKYVLSADVETKFSHTKCPEMTFGSPTLREALTQLMNVLDCIPVVHDNVIHFLDLSQRKAKFSERREQMRQILNSQGITDSEIQEKYPSFWDWDGEDQIPNQSWQNWMMSGGEYADRLRTEYHGAISEQNSTRYVEKLGFRNKNISAMTLSDLQIELSHPIYKINKIYLEYYKKSHDDPNKAVLAKFDITPLVKLNSERQLLSHDWTGLAENDFIDYNGNGYIDINDFAKYYFFTIGYNIGSTSISGWGESLNFSKDGIISQRHSVLENIIVLTSMLSYYGQGSLKILPTDVGGAFDVDFGDFGIVSNLGWDGISGYEAMKQLADNIVTSAGRDSVREPFLDAVKNTVNWFTDLFTGTPALSDYTAILKSVFFEIDYEGMIEGSVISSKDYHDGTVVKRDAVSSSLSVVEIAGSLEKQKANKLGNSTIVTSQRINSPDFLMQIGDYDSDDQIIYQRTTSYDRDFIRVTYYQCKDFVLKNYYTSVYSKIRPFSLTSYAESVTRNENHYEVALFSTSKFLYQSESENFDIGFSVRDAVSFILPNIVGYSWEAVKEDGRVPIVWNASDSDAKYLLEQQVFVSGQSVCISFTMPDSVSMGTYINNWNPSVNAYIAEKYFSENPTLKLGKITPEQAAVNANDEEFLQELSGTIQAWHMIQANVEPIDLVFVSATISAEEKESVWGENSGIETYKIDRFLSPELDYEWDDDTSLYALIQLDANHDGDISDNELNIGAVSSNQEIRKLAIAIRNLKNELPECGVLNKKIMEMPLLPYSYDNVAENIKFIDSTKDQKERINSIAQLEFVSDSDDIFVTQWAARLSDANGTKKKAWAYKNDSVIWFWILQTAYALDGERTSFETNTTMYSDKKWCGYAIDGLPDGNYGTPSVCTNTWSTDVPNPCLAFPVLFVITNSESKDILDRISSSTIQVNQTISWGNYSVLVKNVSFNEQAIAERMTISVGGTDRVIEMLDLNEASPAKNAEINTVHSLQGAPNNINSATPGRRDYQNYIEFDLLSIAKANSVLKTDDVISFGKTIFSNFKAAQSSYMWLSNSTLSDFIIDSTTIGNTLDYPVFMYLEYAVIHRSVNEIIAPVHAPVSNRNFANPNDVYADDAIRHVAFTDIRTYDYDSNQRQWVISEIASCRTLRDGVFGYSQNSYSYLYTSNCGNGTAHIAGKAKAAYIHKPTGIVHLDSGTLYATYCSHKIDAKEAEMLQSFKSISNNEETILTNVTVNGYDVSRIENVNSIMSSISRGNPLSIGSEIDEVIDDVGSIRIYYLDSDEGGDGMMHLVFATNSCSFFHNMYNGKNYIRADAIYVSILDDRSETVIDSHGEPSYRVANFAEDDFDSLGNYCVAKSSD